MPPRISLTELYSMKDKKEQIRYSTFDKIIEMCHAKIRKTAVIGGMNIFFEVPYMILGSPLYKIDDCINYVVNALRTNGLFVQILPHPNTNILYVSWNPSDVTYKKQLGYTNHHQGMQDFPMNI